MLYEGYCLDISYTYPLFFNGEVSLSFLVFCFLFVIWACSAHGILFFIILYFYSFVFCSFFFFYPMFLSFTHTSVDIAPINSRSVEYILVLL